MASDSDILKNHVLLLRFISTDQYKDAIEEAKFKVEHLKTIEVKYPNICEYCDKLFHPENYSGLIFTSQNSVNVTYKAGLEHIILPVWNELFNFAVGESTAQSAKELLNINCQGQEAGNAKSLAELIVKNKNLYTKPFLYPCSNLKRDTLPDIFKENGIDLDIITVYEVNDNPDLESDFIIMTENFTKIPEIWVYFSPSGVKATEKIRSYLPLDQIKFISIGPSTSEELRKQNIPVHAEAKKPTPKDVVEAIKQVI